MSNSIIPLIGLIALLCVCGCGDDSPRAAKAEDVATPHETAPVPPSGGGSSQTDSTRRVTRDAPGALSQERVTALVEKLEDDATRMEALAELISIAKFRMYEHSVIVSDPNDTPEIHKLRKRAALATESVRNQATIGRALERPDRQVRFWGVMSFESRHGKTDEWVDLLPRLKHVAIHDDSGIRAEAVHRLRAYPQMREFLKQRVEEETSASVLKQLVFVRHLPATHAKYNGLMRKLLNHKDVAVRLEALNMIAGNRRTAPMWQVNYDAQVHTKVKQMATAGTGTEKEHAERALRSLQPEGGTR